MDAYSIYPKQYKDARYKLQSDSCFVIMPFLCNLNNTYTTINAAAAAANVKCTRADSVSTTSEPILSKICKEISQSYFIIVDITDLNPNVFYELGISHVLRDAKKVLIIKEESTTCPSDINHLHYYSYSKQDLGPLQKIIEKFFAENNMHEDLYSLLDFHDLLHGDTDSQHSCVDKLSNCISIDAENLLLVLNNHAKSSTQERILNLLNTLTLAFCRTETSDELYPLYSDLILLVISKVNNIFNIAEYISNLFCKGYTNISYEWLAKCSVNVLDNSDYFNIVFSWMTEYLQQASPAEFDVAKYTLEIGIIKSSSTEIDASLVKGLESPNKTFVEHCANLIKERKPQAAIPMLRTLIASEDNPYVVRSCLDALIAIAPLAILKKVKQQIEKRKEFIVANEFLQKHIDDLNNQIASFTKCS